MTVRIFKNFVFVLLLALIHSVTVQAQFLQADIGINGLTCSQCSRSVEMQLRKLPFVQEVQMDLEHTRGTVSFLKGKKVDMAALAKAVRDAGFSLRFLDARIDMRAVTVTADRSFRIGNGIYAIVNEGPVPEGVAVFRFTGKNFSAKKEPSARKTYPATKEGQVLYPVSLHP